jgi:hypothetical protein
MSVEAQHQEVRNLIEDRHLTLHKNVRWEMADYAVTDPATPDRDATTDIEEAEAVSSLIRGKSFAPAPGGFHDVLIDIDHKAVLIPSSTEGHFHLYIPLGCPWDDYLQVLKAAARIGLVEEGYVSASESRGATSLRLPWIKKGEEREAIENGGALPPKRKPTEIGKAPF